MLCPDNVMVQNLYKFSLCALQTTKLSANMKMSAINTKETYNWTCEFSSLFLLEFASMNFDSS